MLIKLNFQVFCVRWFDTLCFEASSLIVYNGHISERIKQKRSCRQGDPLSPYIFVIAMSALLERIKQNKRISGERIGDLEFKLSAYADDTLGETQLRRPVLRNFLICCNLLKLWFDLCF